MELALGPLSEQLPYFKVEIYVQCLFGLRGFMLFIYNALICLFVYCKIGYICVKIILNRV
jgi:hypothetical protein